MKYEIKSCWTLETIFSLESESLKSCVEAAVEKCTDLRGADLRGANLRRANLWGAKNISKYRTTNLHLLRDQIGKIRAYKLVNKNLEGPFNGGIVYKIGKTVSVENADCNENIECSQGISLADLPWCLNHWQMGYKILIAEFTAKDIAAIPIASDGKFRVHRCKIVGEKDLKELGLTKDENTE